MDSLQSQMNQGAPAQAPQGGALPKPNPEIMSPVVAAHMDQLNQMADMMGGKLGDAYDRVLTAGMKMLYSPDNAETMQQIIMDEQVPVANKLGEGVANLMVMMDNTGNGTIPKEVLIPVGIAVMFEAADYLYEVEVEVTEADLGAAIELLIEGIFVGYGIDPAKMDEVIDKMGADLGFKAEPEAEGAPSGDEEVAPLNEDEAMEQGFKEDRAKQAGM